MPVLRIHFSLQEGVASNSKIFIANKISIVAIRKESICHRNQQNTRIKIPVLGIYHMGQEQISVGRNKS